MIVHHTTRKRDAHDPRSFSAATRGAGRRRRPYGSGARHLAATTTITYALAAGVKRVIPCRRDRRSTTGAADKIAAGTGQMRPPVGRRAAWAAHRRLRSRQLAQRVHARSARAGGRSSSRPPTALARCCIAGKRGVLLGAFVNLHALVCAPARGRRAAPAFRRNRKGNHVRRCAGRRRDHARIDAPRRSDRGRRAASAPR